MVSNVLFDHACEVVDEMVAMGEDNETQRDAIMPIDIQLGYFIGEARPSKSTAGLKEPRTIRVDAMDICSYPISEGRIPQTKETVVVPSTCRTTTCNGHVPHDGAVSSNYLDIPLICRTYSAASDQDSQEPNLNGLNRMRMISATVTKYLTNFDIYDYPVFSIITSGATARLCYSYMRAPDSEDMVRAELSLQTMLS